VARLPLQLHVLPSNMPAELLMTYQGEVCGLGKSALVSPVSPDFRRTRIMWRRDEQDDCMRASLHCRCFVRSFHVEPCCSVAAAFCRRWPAACKRGLMARMCWCGSCWA
jgi:hypothetical protein